MPIYNYRCDECGYALQVTAKMSDPPQTDCPECGVSALRRLVSKTGFRLKGGGWYDTGYASSRSSSSDPVSSGSSTDE